LSGTDFAQFRDFSIAAEKYRRVLNAAMNDDIKNSPKEGPYMADERLWSKVPEFLYVTPEVNVVLGQQAWSLGLLVLWALGATGMAGWAATRRLRAE